jgi:YHS domain-containing protein
MPVYKSIDENKKSYYRWGFSGKKYYFTAGDAKQEKEAKQKATNQGIVIENKIKAKKINLTSQNLFYDN